MTEVYRQRTMEVSTIENNQGVVIVEQETRFEVGKPRETGIIAFIRNTYPARYNHVVRNMNQLNEYVNERKKWSMRGGHFFMYRYVIGLAIILSFCFGIVSIFEKAWCAVPFILISIYLLLSIFNTIVYYKNRPLINPLLTRQVPRGVLNGSINEFYAVPLNANIVTGAVAAYVDPAVIAAALREDNIELTEIHVMLYDDRYLASSGFPKEIIGQFIVFSILFILSIAFVSAKAN